MRSVFSDINTMNKIHEGPPGPEGIFVQSVYMRIQAEIKVSIHIIKYFAVFVVLKRKTKSKTVSFNCTKWRVLVASQILTCK